ncbi:MAG TPA: hypothetical protein VI756_19215, partial [Blastocatellia bacterium]
DLTDAVPVVGTVSAEFTAGFTMKLAVTIPSKQGELLLQGVFAEIKPSITNIFQLVGGINLQAILPSQLQLFSDIEVQQFDLRYSYSTNVLTYFGIQLGTPQERTWELVPAVAVKALNFEALITNPASLATRKSQYKIGGDFNIGDGSASINAQVPQLRVFGGLTDDSKPISLESVVKEYLGNQPVPSVIASASINRFSFSVDQALGAYSFAMGVLADWPIEISGTTLFTITEVGFSIDATSNQIDPSKTSPDGANDAGPGTKIVGTFYGSIIILPDSAKIGLTVTATYATQGLGWTFDGKQTSGVVPLGDLLTFYLGPGWEAPTPYDINGLGLKIATKDNSYLFTGKTAEPWAVPFIPELTVSASLTAGYNGQTSPGLTRAGQPEPPAQPGPFGRLETTWTWEGISILLWFDYKPGLKSFGFTWEFLEAEVKQDPKQDNDWIGTLRFSKDVTVGYLVGKMVSWITGSEFGLEAPWSFLNGISLGGLELVYNFTKKIVSFKVKIGPIDLGFARIESIDINYQSGQKDPKNNGVMVTLTGSFPWNIGNGAVGDTSKIGPWDTSKPGTAPAPPGNGNKYFDLRLLAMGQHVTATCFKDATTVQKAIDCLGSLPDTNPGEIPAIAFDPLSSWLIGTEFGVLRFGGDTTAAPTNGTALALAAAPTPVGYVLTMQVVFNDPRLYALRIALAGDAAKIFKGLDFQIMYRQVSDTVGVYQAEITLPDVMRHLSVGAYSITLPVFGIAVYTNGDFMVDIGFPWNEDFSRSFTIEAIIYPGIPLLGSAGFYFGKLSSATTNKVPAATNGTFNPVLVFGFGLQVGFGKSVQYGILSAGFSLTVVGILEGVIATWNPYQLQAPGSNSQVQGSYYFWLRGTVGIIGKLYGSIDFAIIKADVNITIKLLLQFTYESFVSLSMSVIVSVDVSVSIKIDLGLFSIKISFSFSMKIKETFTIDNKGVPPWTVNSAPPAGLLRGDPHRRLRAAQEPLARAMLLTATEANWSNLLPASTPIGLAAYLATALAMARDEWQSPGNQDPKNQQPCYAGMLFIDSVPAVGSAAMVAAAVDPKSASVIYVRFNSRMNSSAATAANYALSGGISITGGSLLAGGQVVQLNLSATATPGTTTVTVSSALKDAAGAALNAPFTKTALAVSDTSFELLCKMVLRWAIAAIQLTPMTAEQIDNLVIADADLTRLLDEILTSKDTNPTPVPAAAVESFMSAQFRLTAQVPPNLAQEADATYFPMAPALKLSLPKYGDQYPGYEYTFADYNSIDDSALAKLRAYF